MLPAPHATKSRRDQVARAAPLAPARADPLPERVRGIVVVHAGGMPHHFERGRRDRGRECLPHPALEREVRMHDETPSGANQNAARLPSPPVRANTLSLFNTAGSELPNQLSSASSAWAANSMSVPPRRSVSVHPVRCSSAEWRQPTRRPSPWSRTRPFVSIQVNSCSSGAGTTMPGCRAFVISPDRRDIGLAYHERPTRTSMPRAPRPARMGAYERLYTVRRARREEDLPGATGARRTRQSGLRRWQCRDRHRRNHRCGRWRPGCRRHHLFIGRVVDPS